MNRPFLILALAALAAGACLLMSSPEEPEWTTDSPEALQAFEDGLVALNKLYNDEAREHFKEALELDPDFAVPKALLLRSGYDRDLRDRLRSELAATSLEELTDREQFLVRYNTTLTSDDPAAAEAVLDEYLANNPDDPHGLFERAGYAFVRGDWDVAEATYEHILETSPNWVVAQNHLGYIEMAQGHFSEAEELFQNYEFVAPDQANPHDSLGELLTVTGRYPEAQQQLEQALAIKPDFCGSYEHLVDLLLLQNRLCDGEPIVERAREHCGGGLAETLSCRLDLWQFYIDKEYERAWLPEHSHCLEKSGELGMLSHRLEVLTGRHQDALAREAAVRNHVQALGADNETVEADFLRSMNRHMEAVRLAAEGDYETAIKLFTEADEEFIYWGNSGIMKLYNRLNLAAALGRTGQTRQEQEVLEAVGAVNPAFAAEYDEILVPGPD